MKHCDIKACFRAHCGPKHIAVTGEDSYHTILELELCLLTYYPSLKKSHENNLDFTYKSTSIGLITQGIGAHCRSKIIFSNLSHHICDYSFQRGRNIFRRDGFMQALPSHILNRAFFTLFHLGYILLESRRNLFPFVLMVKGLFDSVQKFLKRIAASLGMIGRLYFALAFAFI